MIKEASRSEDFDRIYDASNSEDSHASAAKTLLMEDRVAYVCEVAIEDAPPSGDKALYIKYTPGQPRLFPEEDKHSYSSYKAYDLGPGMQATIEAGRGDVRFPCNIKDRDSVSVTGTIYNDLDLSRETRFRILFRSSLKMAKLLKCGNEIKFPASETMKPLPMAEN
ncbi:hypothetical protein [Streptomyces glaucus]